MIVRLEPFMKSAGGAPPLNAIQERVAFRLKGGLGKYTKEDLTDSIILEELRQNVGRDPDAIEEVFCNGVIKALRSALVQGSEEAAEFMVELSEMSGGVPKYSYIIDDETRPRPYWIHFGLMGSLLVRYMRPNQRGLGTRPNFEVGFTLWGASLVLSRMIALRELDLEGKDVLELGSGLGVCGLACAVWGKCASVVLTDFHPAVVENCRFNIALNGLEAHTSASILDWETPLEEDVDGMVANKRFNVVIGSDVVCQSEDCFAIARMLDHFLLPGGLGVFCLGSAESRYGVSEFPSTMESSGYHVEVISTSDGDLSPWVESFGENLDLLVGCARSYSVFAVHKRPH